MYFRLTADLNLNCGSIAKEVNVSTAMMKGRPLNAAELVLPWRFSVEQKRDEPLQMSDFYPYPMLMNKRLIAAIQSAGVDNLQLFDAEIVDKKSNDVNREYQVVNVVGRVSAADPGASKSRPLANLRFFEKLVLDESRTHGQLMFRLAESLTDIIIAEKVAKRIEDGGFVDVVVSKVGAR
ncbi:MAG: hypothetical protein ACYDAE_09365 [Steroidobacteraceae bacterium]